MKFARYGPFILMVLLLPGCEDNIDRSVNASICFNEALDKEGTELIVDYIYRLKDSHNYSYGAGEKVVTGGEVWVPNMPGTKAIQFFSYKRKKDKNGRFYTLDPSKPEGVFFSTRDILYAAIEGNEGLYYFPSGMQTKRVYSKGKSSNQRITSSTLLTA